MFLIGTKDSKRTDYMKKAAVNEKIPFKLLEWDTLQPLSTINRPQESILQIESAMEQLHGAAVKIEPPPSQTFYLEQMNELLNSYQTALGQLSKAKCHFLNTPETICRLLDKKETKNILIAKEVPVTEIFPENIYETEQLLEFMKRRRCYSVFIKPRYFSGAAGVAAFRLHPAREKFCLYTSCRMEADRLINTKKLSRMENRQEIFAILDKLLAMDCIVERWHPKADFNGKSYDLRVVFQFGHIAYIVARQSTGPITNLHLNNRALSLQSLKLKQNTLNEIENICVQALSAFHGLSMAGLDILLEKGTLKPRIIEMNGQGDLIYQDIFGENQIYTEQVKWLYRQETYGEPHNLIQNMGEVNDG